MGQPRRGFTLVEILIVVVLLGILAAIVIPNLNGLPRMARETNLKENLSKIRVHIQVYRNEHGDFPTADKLGEQLTKCTNFAGDVADARSDDYHYGPYIEQMPPNPISGAATVRAASGPEESGPSGDADGGWWYNETTGQFYADLRSEHVDDTGAPYNQY